MYRKILVYLNIWRGNWEWNLRIRTNKGIVERDRQREVDREIEIEKFRYISHVR
jgi:hypothetical protein